MSPAEPEDVVEAPDPATHDDAIRAVVSRLARPHASGGMVVERAALLAEGADFAASRRPRRRRRRPPACTRRGRARAPSPAPIARAASSSRRVR